MKKKQRILVYIDLAEVIPNVTQLRILRSFKIRGGQMHECAAHCNSTNTNN